MTSDIASSFGLVAIFTSSCRYIHKTILYYLGDDKETIMKKKEKVTITSF